MNPVYTAQHYVISIRFKTDITIQLAAFFYYRSLHAVAGAIRCRRFNISSSKLLMFPFMLWQSGSGVALLSHVGNSERLSIAPSIHQSHKS